MLEYMGVTTLETTLEAAPQGSQELAPAGGV
jgi:hypothetical protein